MVPHATVPVDRKSGPCPMQQLGGGILGGGRCCHRRRPLDALLLQEMVCQPLMLPPLLLRGIRLPLRLVTVPRRRGRRGGDNILVFSIPTTLLVIPHLRRRCGRLVFGKVLGFSQFQPLSMFLLLLLLLLLRFASMFLLLAPASSPLS
jgi:hypothetical protein